MNTHADSALQRARSAMDDLGVDALLVGPGADLRYLTGYRALALERLTLLVARADGATSLFVPELERARALASPLPDVVEVVSFAETEDPYALVAERLDDGGRYGVGDRLWATFLLHLQQRLAKSEWVTSSTVTRHLRMSKSPEEVDALRRAGQAIDRVHEQVPSLLRPGRTEAQVGREVADLILAEGHEAVNFVIVASGPNGASPHHETGERALVHSDAVVVDIGGTLDGYCSDCTRNYVIGAAADGYTEAHAALEAAQIAACNAVGPGVTAESVDAVARLALRDAGYGEFFVHRTGHGIGLEEHEDPYIVEGNDLILRPGMTFSIEPGVYLPDRFGIRIEDIVAVTEDGCERLNTLSRAAVPV
ncbi:MAG: M24 family metallopeptidase [Nitriliruptorales bacterium]|nr:M24 family metallopeptidase [Nitriliruptorales bacterium]